MAIKQLGHVNLRVADLDRAVGFYRDVLGLPLVAGGTLRGHRLAFFSTGSTHHELALVEATTGEQPGLDHIGWQVGHSLADLRAMRDALRAAGHEPHRYVDHRVCQSLHVRDPDGHALELHADGDPALWRDMPQTMVTADPLTLD